jgi:hypothetical protein
VQGELGVEKTMCIDRVCWSKTKTVSRVSTCVRCEQLST